MGQKVNPVGFRVGFNKDWESRWFATKEYQDLLHEDLELRKDLLKRLKHAGVSRVDLERAGKKLTITIATSRPGVIIGKKGSEVDRLRDDIQKKLDRDVYIKIDEIHRPEIEAQLVAENIALQLTKRVAFRRAMKRSIDMAMKFGALGVKIRVAGRLNGAEISRAEWYLQGRLPLQTLRSDIDYGLAVASTTYGVLGVKVWIYKGQKVRK